MDYITNKAKPHCPSWLNANQIVACCFCWGTAGSRWLARALNAHPHQLWVHAPAEANKGRSTAEAVEHTLGWLRRFNNHPVVGLTHGTQIGWYEEIKAHFEGQGVKFRPFVLVRHPVPRARSIMALDANNPHRPELDWWQAGAKRAYAKLDDGFFPSEFQDLSFYRAAESMNLAMAEAATGLPIWRIEDLSMCPEALDRLTWAISDGMLQYPGKLAKEMQDLRIGVHAGGYLQPGEIWLGWPDHWRAAWYKLIDQDTAQAYEAMGYALP